MSGTLRLGMPTRLVAAFLLPVLLAACETNDAGGSISFTPDGGDAAQAFPGNYRKEMLAFLRTYLNNPVGVHDAVIAEPVPRAVGGRMRYVSCLRYSERQSDGSYRQPRDQAILFVNGRLDRMIQNAGEQCVGAVYAPFPEMEKMQR